jgi:hypothetical protein
MLLNIMHRGVLPRLVLCWAIISSMTPVAAETPAIQFGQKKPRHDLGGDAAELTIQHNGLNQSSKVLIDRNPIILESDGETTVSLRLLQSPMISKVIFTCKNQTRSHEARLFLVAGHQHFLTLNHYKDLPITKMQPPEAEKKNRQ